MNLPNNLSLFDAVEVIRFPEGKREIDAYYSYYAEQKIRIGDVGVVIGDWLGDRVRVEAVDSDNSIVWQDQFYPDQLKLVEPTAAQFCRRRINEHWAWQNSINGRISDEAISNSLKFACKVMSFVKRNIDMLVDRLEVSGFQFVDTPIKPPVADAPDKIAELHRLGVFIPIALQSWLIEIGEVNLCGTHPDWKKTGWAGLNDSADSSVEPWYTDPLCIQVPLDEILEDAKDGNITAVDLAPDDTTKANVSGDGSVFMHCSRQRFDDVVVGQHGSLTLYSYLHHAFNWSGFPGFRFIPDAPMEMIEDWKLGLTTL